MICPIMSGPEKKVHCIGSKCAWWRWMLTPPEAVTGKMGGCSVAALVAPGSAADAFRDPAAPPKKHETLPRSAEGAAE